MERVKFKDIVAGEPYPDRVSKAQRGFCWATVFRYGDQHSTLFPRGEEVTRVFEAAWEETLREEGVAETHAKAWVKDRLVSRFWPIIREEVSRLLKDEEIFEFLSDMEVTRSSSSADIQLVLDGINDAIELDQFHPQMRVDIIRLVAAIGSRL